MKYKLIASDLDGTLLTLEQTVSPENRQAIKALYEKGVYFVPCSGRALAELPPQMLEDPLYRYYIVSNGAAIYDKATDTMEEFAISGGLVKDVMDVLDRFDLFITVRIGKRSYCDIDTHNEDCCRSFHMNKYWVTFVLDMISPHPELKSYIHAQSAIQCIAPFFRSMEDKKACRAILEKDPRLSVAETDPYNLEIFSSTAGKGNALMHLADRLQIPREATIAVGDNINDSSMILAAGLGLAVENAHPDLKEQADAIICDFREHSARYILEHYYV